jgi:hypothetical protein
MVELSKRFGMSDVGLAKIFKKHAIPRPPVGHWAKLKHGRKVTIPPLPDCPQGVSEEIQITMRSPTTAAVQDEGYEFFDDLIRQQYDELSRGDGLVEVAKVLRSCHPVTRRTRDWLASANRKPTRDERGVLQYLERYQGTHIHMSVSKNHHRRALLILDALIKTLIAVGVNIHEIKDDWYCYIEFELCEFRFCIRIKERNKRIDHIPTKEELDRERRTGMSWANRYDYEPTGDLRIELFHHQHRTKITEFSDAKRTTLESRIQEIVLFIIRTVDEHLKQQDAHRRWEIERVEQARLQREQDERDRQNELERQHEQARRKRLLELSEGWVQSKQLVQFIEEVRERLFDTEFSSNDRSLMGRWLEWAEEYSKDLDPFSGELMNLPRYTHNIQ